MICKEIILEIDSTLDRLIHNAEALQNASIQDLSETEIAAFQKTQESLVRHLIRMDEVLESKTKNLKQESKKNSRNQIQEKRDRFEKLKESCHKDLHSLTLRKSELLAKRRRKQALIT
jgi:hypothetical protein